MCGVDYRAVMSVSDIKIPSGTLAELRGVLVRALSRENLSVSDKLAIRKSHSSSSLKIHYAFNSNSSYGGKELCGRAAISVYSDVQRKYSVVASGRVGRFSENTQKVVWLLLILSKEFSVSVCVL